MSGRSSRFGVRRILSGDIEAVAFHPRGTGHLKRLDVIGPFDEAFQRLIGKDDLPLGPVRRTASAARCVEFDGGDFVGGTGIRRLCEDRARGE